MPCGDWTSINAGLLDVVALFRSPSVASPYCTMKMLFTKKLKCHLGDIDTFVHTIFIYLRNNDECVGETSTLFDLDSGFSKRLRVILDGEVYLGWNPRGLKWFPKQFTSLQTRPEIGATRNTGAALPRLPFQLGQWQ